MDIIKKAQEVGLSSLSKSELFRLREKVEEELQERKEGKNGYHLVNEQDRNIQIPLEAETERKALREALRKLNWGIYR